MFKMTFMTHLDTSNTSYGQKKGRESNWQFDSRPLKVRNCPNFLACRWHATYHWKALNEGYNFVLDVISIGGLHTNFMGPQSYGNLSCGNFGTFGTKWHLGVGHVARHRIYYKGEGGGFPQVWAIMILVNLSLLVARPSTKSAPTLH
jgi:hypothetical protein